MVDMKKYIPILFALAALAGCETIYVPSLQEVPVRPTNVKPNVKTTKGEKSAAFSLASSHWSDVSKIRDEATRLSYQVSQGKMTKVQAAQYLTAYMRFICVLPLTANEAKSIPNNPSCISKTPCADGSNAGKIWVTNLLTRHLPTS